MLYVHLTNEEKLLALVLALGLFLVSAVLSVCLVSGCCPLNRWLARRANAKRQRRHSYTTGSPSSVLVGPQQQLHQNLHHYHRHQAAANYYLYNKHPQSAGSLQHHRNPIFVVDKPPPAYDVVCSRPPLQMGRNPFMNNELAQDSRRDKPPDLKVSSGVPNTSPSEKQHNELDFGDYFHQPCEMGPAIQQEPHMAPTTTANLNLCSPAMANHKLQAATAKAPIMLRLWAQVMEPDKLQELMEGSQKEQQQKPTLTRLSRQLSIPQLFGSIVSLTSGTLPSSSSSSTPSGLHTNATEKHQQQITSTNTSDSSATSIPQSQPAPLSPADQEEAPTKPLACGVLHTNVASFSYLSDLELSADRKRLEAGSQTCQLLVGICDIENLLNTSWQLERSCAHLTSSSAIYAQCELLASRPSRTKLLRHPLKALQAAAACPMAGKWAVYEPTTDGRCVLVFNSQPRQVELVLASSGNSAGVEHPSSPDRADMIPFNSVFVGPPMSKKALEGARLSVRLYSRSRYLNETCLAELNIPLKRLLDIVNSSAGLGSQQCSSTIQDNNPPSTTTLNNPPETTPSPPALVQPHEGALKQLLAHLLPTNGLPASANHSTAAAATTNHTTASKLSPYCKGAEATSLRNSCSADAALCQLATCAFRGEQQPEWAAEEQLYWRSLMAAHWLNQMPNSIHECQTVLERRASLVLGLSYLPTSNRVIFNAHRAQIVDSSAPGQSLVKELRIHTGTCYLLRFLMVVNGRVIRRKQTPAASRPEWDDQEPITFDLASVGVATPVFLVLLVLCQPTIGSGRKPRRACADHSASSPTYHQAGEEGHYGAGAQSEPETSGSTGPNSTCALCRQGRSSRLELVLAHTTLASETWRELRAQPRRQLVSQLDMY